ncbi:MAG: hypothetical protein PUA84_09650 [Oscillospiraceae bacterium]|nr:hypothetical protein [Oscillospiraceae bacterium]
MSKYNSVPDKCPEAVPIKVRRVFDSCSDRDCLSNIQLILDCGSLPADISIVKSRCVKVKDISMTVEPVPFNKGFYSIDLTYTFSIELMAYEKSCGSPTLITAKAYAGKNVVLYGGEASSKIFFSDDDKPDTYSKSDCCEFINLPSASVQVVEPIALETKIVMSERNKDKDSTALGNRTVVMTIGVFSVIELYRPVTIMVPTYEYTIPTKECHIDSESPCAVFDRIRFPSEQFIPGGITDSSFGMLNSCDYTGKNDYYENSESNNNS